MGVQAEQLVKMEIRVPVKVRDKWTKFCQEHEVDRNGQTQNAIEQVMDYVDKNGWIIDDGTEVES